MRSGLRVIAQNAEGEGISCRLVDGPISMEFSGTSYSISIIRKRAIVYEYFL